MNNFYHVIKDPVHGVMQFTSEEDAWIKPFIDSPNFQRLRHIKQLGLGDLIFPGAVHTRFNHSLGCAYIANQIASKIGLSQSDKQLVMIACLLHDIGHGPFSHAFEGIFDHNIRHEDWTPFFLADYRSTLFFDLYNARNTLHKLSLEKYSRIESMIMHQRENKTILADIVSSQLDADRLDYLLRDSHFCGVAYGQFDFRWLLHCLTIIKNNEETRLGITHKGIGAVEHYLMARRLMMRNIYHGHKKLAIEALLIHLLQTLSKQMDDYKFLLNTKLGKFLAAAHLWNLEKTPESSKNHKDKFLREYYPIYKTLVDYDVFALIEQLTQMTNKNAAHEIAWRIQNRIMPKIVRLKENNLDVIRQEVQAFKAAHQNEFADWQLMLIQTPHQSYSIGEDPIWVLNEDGKVIPITEISFMINALSDRLEHLIFVAIDQAILQNPKIIHFISYLQAL